MFVAYGFVDLHLPYSHSLKDKRGLLQGVSSRIRKRFYISLAEIDHQELWQRSRFGFSAVAKDMATLNLIVNSIRESFENYSDQLEVIDFMCQIVSL
ncbi:MAG: DUF503 domain-containing protein [Syntrophomonadaceae bacterium]|nr:DUF503 domain-containing protein [Syntrophomonadaceae bacterium]